MIRLAYMLFISTLSMSCQQLKSESIDAEVLKNLQSEGVTVIDIRTPQEYIAGHIPKSTNINFLSPDFLGQISEYKGQPMIIHCQSGGRSGKAIKILTEAGFEKVYHYPGGFSDWKNKGGQIEK